MTANADSTRAPARGSPDAITLPRHVVCAVQFAAAQLAARLERVVSNPPGRIDQAILGNARDALVALHAAIELDLHGDRGGTLLRRRSIDGPGAGES